MDLMAQLLAHLQGCLSADTVTQKASEEALRQATTLPGYAAGLVEVTGKEDVDPEVRKLAGGLLQQTVKAHWSPSPTSGLEDGSSERSDFLISDDEKVAVRRGIIPALLQSQDPEVCTSMAAAVSTISSEDWPDHWPNLLDDLLQPLSNPAHSSAVLPSLKCLALVAEDAEDRDLPLIIRKTFPALLAVVSNSQGYGVSARTAALQVVHACIASLARMRGAQQRETSDLLCSLLPTWIPQFLSIISQTVASDLPLWGICLEALKCLTQIVKNCGGVLEPKLAEVLSSLWQSWVASTTAFEAQLVQGNNPKTDADGVANKEINDLCGPAKLEAVTVQTFEFILSLLESSKFHEHIRPAVEATVYFSIPFMQITQEKEDCWLRDPNQFVSDEEENLSNCRASGCMLIEGLVQTFEDYALTAISVAVQRRLVDSSTLRNQGSLVWWKLREATMLAVGSVADKFIGREMSGVKFFDSAAFLDMLLTHDLGPGGAENLPFLYSRCLWATGRFCPVAGQKRLTAILDCAISSLDSAKPPVIHVGACRALSRVIPNTPQELLQQVIEKVYQGISGLLPTASGEVLHLILELLETVVKAGKQTSEAVEAGVTPALLRIWSENLTEPVISCHATDVLEAIADSPDCFPSMVTEAVPFLKAILDADAGRSRAEERAGDGKVAGAIEIVTTLVKKSSSQDTSRALCEALFPPIARIMATSHDKAELQSGAEALSAFLSRCGKSLLAWSQQPEGTMKLLLDIAVRQLSPDTDDLAAAFVGPYLEQLRCRFPSHLGPHMESLVRAIIVKLGTNSLPTLSASLLLVLSGLIHSCDTQQRTQLVEFLAANDAPGGEERGTLLALLVKEWCHYQGEIHGRRKRDMAVSALALLLATQDHRLESTSVEACTHTPMASGVTGSSSSNRVGSTPNSINPVLVPFPVKCFTFFAETLLEAQEEKAQEGSAANKQSQDEEEEDEEDSDEESDSESEDRFFEGAADPLSETDFLQILQSYVLGISQANKDQVTAYQELFSDKQQQVLQQYLHLPPSQKQ